MRSDVPLRCSIVAALMLCLIGGVGAMRKKQKLNSAGLASTRSGSLAQASAESVSEEEHLSNEGGHVDETANDWLTRRRRSTPSPVRRLIDVPRNQAWMRFGANMAHHHLFKADMIFNLGMGPPNIWLDSFVEFKYYIAKPWKGWVQVGSEKASNVWRLLEMAFAKPEPCLTFSDTFGNASTHDFAIDGQICFKDNLEGTVRMTAKSTSLNMELMTLEGDLKRKDGLCAGWFLYDGTTKLGCESNLIAQGGAGTPLFGDDPVMSKYEQLNVLHPPCTRVPSNVRACVLGDYARLEPKAPCFEGKQCASAQRIGGLWDRAGFASSSMCKNACYHADYCTHFSYTQEFWGQCLLFKGPCAQADAVPSGHAGTKTWSMGVCQA